MNILRKLSPADITANLPILAFNALLIGALWVATLELVHSNRRDALETAIGRNDNLAIAFEQYTVRTLENADSLLQFLIREFGRRGGTIDLDRFMADHTIDHKAYTGVVIADEQGNVSTTAYRQKPAKPVNVADREQFKVHLAAGSNALFVGKPVAGRVTGRLVVPLTRRINKTDGSFGGVAMVLIEHSRFTDVLQDAKLRQLDILSLVGMDGITRARLRSTTHTAGEDISKSPLFAEQAKRPVGNYAAHGQVDGVKRIFSYRTLANYPLIATVGAAEADVLAAHYRQRQQYFWVAGIASVLIAGFTLLLISALTSQRRAARTLARNQARFLATFNQAAVGIAHSDLDGYCLEVNQKLCDITGYAREELVGRKFTDITHPDDIAASIQLRRQVVAEHDPIESQQREKRYIRKDGSIVWCLLTTSVVRDEAGHIDYLAAVVQDITDRKAAEQALGALEQEQRRLAEQAEAERARLAEAQAVAKIGSWETRFPDLQVTWSAETHRIFGTDAGSFRPTHEKFLAFVHPEDRAIVETAFSSSVEVHSSRTIEHRIVLADGSIKFVEERWSTFLDDHGQPSHAVGTCQDITDKIKAEQDRAQLAAIVESSSDAIVSRGMDGRIVSWNAAAERLFGWTAAEAIGRPAQIMTPPDYLGKFILTRERVILGGTAPPFETVRQRKDGTRFDAQISLSPIKDSHGKVTGIATIVRDIREQKLAEAALRDYAERMRQMSQRLNTVEENERRSIHRELHDQIGANLSALKLDLSLINSMLDADARKTVGSRLQRAQQLTGETITRIRDVMGELRPPALDDYGLLAALRTHAQPFAARLGIPVHVTGNEIEPRLSIAAETALFRIAQEALTNIAKHARANKVVITLDSNPGRVTLVITDDGTGFDAGNSSTQRDSWGLRTMRERAQAIGAELRIESSPGSGAKVIVEVSRKTA